MVKGWAVDRAAAALRELPDTDFCLSAGGDLTCRGVTRPEAAPWRIGVEDPEGPESGGGRWCRSGPERSPHPGPSIAEHTWSMPGTGRPPAAVASVTVVADTLTTADIDATAAYALGPGAVDWLATRSGRTGLVVWRDGARSIVGEPA